MKRSPLALVVLVCVVLIGAAPASAGKHAPAVVDTWISGSSGRAGQGILSGNAQGQILDTPAAAPDTLSFKIHADVSGRSTAVTFDGGGGSPDFQVQYLSATGEDITSKVAGRGYTIRKVPDGGTVWIQMVVRVVSSASGHSGILAVKANADMVAAYVLAS